MNYVVSEKEYRGDFMAYVKWFSEISKDDVPIAGGKGANLGEMTQIGLPIPPGFVVTANAYWDFINRTGLKDRIFEILRSTNVDDTDELDRNTKKIRDLIKGTKMPMDMEMEIVEAYRKLCNEYNGGQPVNVAVRSSATAEDMPDASFAGQQDTYLDVVGEEDVVKNVQSCWASLFTPRATFYREKQGYSHEKVKLAAVVQKMVNSEVSGVMFTADPTGDTSKIVIEAAYGLGEAVVGGMVTPDTYILSKNPLKIVSKHISKQTWKVDRAKSGKGTEHVDIPEELQDKQKLPDDKIIELAKLGLTSENHYNHPQDMEWAYEGGKLYIVQSRAITTLKLKKKVEEEEKIEVKGEVLTKGLAASPGIATGPVKVVHDLSELDKVQKGDILVTVMTNPDMVPAMKRAAAIVTDEGGMTCHAAIVGRELGIPSVVGTGNITQLVKDGDIITVDATRGFVYKGEVQIEKKEEIDLSTLPKTKTHIYLNLGIPDMAEKYAKLPVDGVGLMREEFIVATYIKKHPLKAIEEGKEQEWIDKLADGVARVCKAFYPRPVVLRFSDFKTNEYRDLEGGNKYEPQEDNPMLGWRGCSRYYSPKYEPAFRLELRAIKKVRDSGLDNLWVMLPFVRKQEEVKNILKIMEEEGLKRSDNFKVWIMAEVPSVALLSEEFAELVDGFSIGSNDLTQLVLGVDRDSEMLGRMGLFDERDPAVKKAISMIIHGARSKGRTVSLCGQAPSNYPEFAKFLVEQGITSISVNPDAFAKVKKVVAETEKELGISPDQ